MWLISCKYVNACFQRPISCTSYAEVKFLYDAIIFCYYCYIMYKFVYTGGTQIGEQAQLMNENLQPVWCKIFNF